jgi:hypothetical protein
MSFRQYRVTIGGETLTTNEHGKFVPIQGETVPTDTAEAANGNDVPKEDA